MSDQTIQDAVSELQHRGGQFTFVADEPGAAPVGLSFTFTGITNADLQTVGILRSLKHLSLALCPVSDLGIARLAGLTQLEDLDLSQTRITDEALQFLRGMTNLTHLNLSSTAITGVGFKYLSHLQNLNWLELNSTPTNDAGLKQIGQLKGVETLSLTGTLTSDEGLRHLNIMPVLRYLDLSDTRISDAGIHYLKQIASLSSVDLRNTWMTAAGAASLAPLSVQAPTAGDLRFRDPTLRAPRLKIGGQHASIREAPWASVELPKDNVRLFALIPGENGQGPELVNLPVAGEFYVVEDPPQCQFYNWFLFMPYPASVNGWADDPHLLPLSAIVRFEALAGHDDESPGPTMIIKVLDVIPLREFGDRFDPFTEPSTAANLLQTVKASSRTRHYWQDDLCFVYSNYESDVIIWSVCQRTPTQDVLLIHGGHGFGWSYCTAGYRPLSSKESRMILLPCEH